MSRPSTVDPAVFEPPLDGSRMETVADRRWDEVVSELGVIGGQINALFGRVTEIAAAVDEENLLAHSGVNTVAQFLAWQLGLSTGRAQQLAKIATRRTDLPAVTGLLDDGLLSADQVAPIAARLPGEEAADRHFAELAPNLTVAQIRKAVQATIPADELPDHDRDDNDPSLADDGQDGLGPRSISFGHRDDGTWTASIQAGTADGGHVETGLRAHYDALWNEYKELLRSLDDDAEKPLPPTWFDALERMVDRSLEREAADRPHSQRTKILLHVDAGRTDLAQLHLGPALTAAERALLSCDASIATVLEDHGTPVSVGRTHRIVPDRTRAIIEHRDGGCVIPWCNDTKKLVAHHITHWEDGGTTDTDNLVSVCTGDHRAIHAGHITITGNPNEPGGLVIIDRRKRRITGRSAAQPPDQPPPPPPNAYQHPWGTGMDWRHWLAPHLCTAT